MLQNFAVADLAASSAVLLAAEAASCSATSSSSYFFAFILAIPFAYAFEICYKTPVGIAELVLSAFACVDKAYAALF